MIGRLMFGGLMLAALFMGARANAATEGAWTSLLDESLSRWEIYLGVPDPSLTVPGYTRAADPKQVQPLGLNNDPLCVFTVKMIEGEPVLHITGQIFGVISTRADYGNYHFRVQMRWGTAKHAPRADKPRDSGILYHCFSRYVGTPTEQWTRSLECQVQEKDIGDLYALGGRADVAAEQYSIPGAAKPFWRYAPGQPLREFIGRCSHGSDYNERPNGEWNTVEVIAVGNRSLHILNGRVVNVLHNTRNGTVQPATPLVSGPIQLQSEGAECEYRRVEIRSLSAMPAEYEKLFVTSTGSS